MEYSVVVVTRNRKDALKLSLPLLVGQSRPPLEIIVVDSTDDPAPIRAIVDEVARSTADPRRIHPQRPGHDAAAQHRPRARAAARSRCFPTTTSLLFPDAMQRDHAASTSATPRALSAASAAPRSPGRRRTSPAPPRRATPARPGPARPGSRSAAAAQLKARLVADPFAKLADRKYARLRAPAWLARGGGHPGRAHDRLPHVVPHRGDPRLALRREPRPLRALRRRRRIAARPRQPLPRRREPRARLSPQGPRQPRRRADARRDAHPQPRLRALQAQAARPPHGLRRLSVLLLQDPRLRHRLALAVRPRPARRAFAAYRALPELFAASPEQLATVYRDLRVRCVGT